MTPLSTAEATAWWQARYLQYTVSLDARSCPGPAQAFLNIDVIPAAKLRHVARTVAAWLFENEQQSALLWIQEWGIWPSSEDRHLYAAWKQSRASTQTLDESPGHLLAATEEPDLQSLVFMGVAFGWGWLAATADGQRALRVNHDGHMRVIAEASDVASRIAVSLCT